MRLSRGARSIEQRLVWILGSPRSGSTWLLNLVRWHPRVVGIDEPLIGAHLGVHKSVVAPSVDGPFSGPTLLEAEAGRPSYVFSERFEDAWLPPLRALLLERFAAEVASRNAPARDPLVVIKEPNGSHGAPLLFRVLPRSRLVFLVRDARDVVDSALDMAIAFERDDDVRRADEATRRAIVTEAARQWAARVASVRSVYDSLPDDERILLRYEELRADPLPHVLRLFSWLGIEVDEAEAAAMCDKLAFENVPDEQRGSGRFHRAASPGLWRENLTGAEQDIVARVTSGLNADLGY